MVLKEKRLMSLNPDLLTALNVLIAVADRGWKFDLKKLMSGQYDSEFQNDLLSMGLNASDFTELMQAPFFVTELSSGDILRETERRYGVRNGA
jgi:hypothetical protein